MKVCAMGMRQSVRSFAIALLAVLTLTPYASGQSSDESLDGIVGRLDADVLPEIKTAVIRTVTYARHLVARGIEVEGRRQSRQ